MKNCITVLLCCCMAAGRLFAQPSGGIELAEKYSGENLSSLLINGSISPHWLNNSSSFYYSLVENGKTVYYLVDPVRGKKIVYTLPVAKPAKKGATKTAPKGIVYTPTDYSRKYSSDSNWYVYGYRHDVYCQRKEDTVAYRLTFDGEPYYSYVSSNAAATDDKRSAPAVYWMKKSHKFIALREDKRKVGEMTIINSLAQPRPTAYTYKFPMPGDKDVVQYELTVFDAAAQTARRLDIAKYPDQKIILQSTIVNGRTNLFAGATGQDERYVYFLRRSRTNSQMDLCRLDITNDSITEILTENCAPHFNDQLFNCRILNNGDDILWWSERTGYGNYYLYDRNGKEKAMLGNGKFVSGDIFSIDTAGRSLIMEVYGMDPAVDPTYRMYARVNFDGSDLTLLTPGDGDHDMIASPDKRYFVDTWSRMDMPPVHELRNWKGKLVMKLGEGDISALLKTGWKLPERLKVKAADGSTDLYGLLYTPFNLDTTRKYPLISNVYPGPQDDQLPRKFTIDDNYNQSLAQLGAVVINVAYRGSGPYRGRDFYCFGYGNLRDYALADDKFIIEQLAARRAYIDLKRIGIYGHSGGGFMSATAILTHPDFYQVAVAASGNFDSNIYTQWWGETYHGIKQTDKGFESRIPTTVELASRLKGKLFLITGDEDRNVHPAQTLRLVDALIKHNKRFDMMVLPGKDHGLGDKYYTNLIRYYFLDNLISVK
ncbi:MAG: prolyl oligopeptidase family serine peptidase [Candidatus Pseudobacter hemicellulosilyticus]|uniref:Prolyl oligopeptidase family serine peptidase n=1 Tax=Candidatus Pseudobacter hemicellulosilyticus TaxID=3121375 RepID=A0AAJ6BE52_9BACT|nr:MAG: prolyl oligopeptidase family serine peptidase [Pseudobacter sp.]